MHNFFSYSSKYLKILLERYVVYLKDTMSVYLKNINASLCI